MIQSWEKLGLLYKCDRLHPKLLSHAANPLPIHLEGDIYRVFFSARDHNQRSSIGGVDIDIVTRRVVAEHTIPFFTHGSGDSFYSHGVSIGNTYEVDGVTYMLFMGWQCPEGGHWFGEIGRLVVNKDLTLQIDSETPFLGLDEFDPISLSYPWVLRDKDKYRMWYGSTVAWDGGNGEMLHVIKYAESVDGENWIKFGQVIGSILGVAQAFSRPTVYIDKFNRFHMWFSYRSGDGTPYRIGYSSSDDGIVWSPSQVCLVPGEDSWDDTMVEYPFVIMVQETLLMLYNGNFYGETGFGYAHAILEDQ